MPEHAQLAEVLRTLSDCTHRTVHAQELVVAGHDLDGALARVIEQDEVLEQIQEIALVAQALEQGFHVHRAGFGLFQPLPVVEMLVLAAQRAHLGLAAVGQQQEGVVVEQMRDGVLVVLEVLVVGLAQVLVDVLAFDEQQRDAVDEADDVRSPAVQIALDPQLAHGQEVVVVRRIEVEHAQAARIHAAVVLAEGDLHAVTQQPVFVAVGGHAALARADLHDLAERILVGHQRQAGVQGNELFAQDAGQHHIFFTGAAEAALRPQHFGVVGVLGSPAQHVAQIVRGGLLDQGVFVQGHAWLRPLRLPRNPAGRTD